MPDPFVRQFFTGLERRRASDSDGCWLEMARMGMESHHRVADDITPSWISSSLGGFAKRTDWRSHCEATSGFLPSSSPTSMPKSNRSSSTIVKIREEREPRRCRRELSFFLVVGHWVLSGVVRRRAQSFRERLCLHEWISILQARHFALVKSLLPQSTPTLLPFSPHSRCLIRDALRCSLTVVLGA